MAMQGILPLLLLALPQPMKSKRLIYPNRTLKYSIKSVIWPGLTSSVSLATSLVVQSWKRQKTNNNLGWQDREYDRHR